jgi:hypothetical protein
MHWGVSNVIPDAARVGFGARGILRSGIVDIPPNRVHAHVFSESEDDKLLFGSWYRKTGVKWMEKEAKKIYGSDSDHHVLDDGRFHMVISAQASHGYLYITAWLDAE